MAGADSGFPGKPGHVYGIWGPLHNYSRTCTVVAIVAAGLGDRSCVMMRWRASALYMRLFAVAHRCVRLLLDRRVGTL